MPPKPEHVVDGNAAKVGAFIVTYRRPRLLQETLASILAQTHPLECVVVLNNDPDNDIRSLLNESAPGVTVVNLKENTGSAGGFAAALRMAQEQGLTWAWLFDDDALPHADALERLLAAYAANGDKQTAIGILVPTQMSSHAVFGVSQWRGREHNIPHSMLNGTQPYLADVAYWAGMLIHRSVIDAVGYPRSDFFRCFADYEYCLRVRAAGWRLLAVPLSRMFHDHGNPRVVVRLGRSSVRFNYSPSRSYYHARNAAYTMRFMLRSPLASLHHALHELRLGIGDLVYSDRKMQRLRMRLLGLADGFRGRLGRRDDLE